MKRHNKKTIVLCLLLSIFLYFVFSTIAYSAINGTIKITGDAYARVETDVRITDLRLGVSLNATSNYENFGKNHISTEVNLTNSSSKIMYYIEITNYGSNDIGIYDITGLPEGVSYSISNYNLHDKICDDTGKCNNFAKKTLELTLTTTSSYSGSLQLNFDFRTFHKVTYTGLENMGYPTEVIDGGTFKITFKEALKRVVLIYNNREMLNYPTVSIGHIITLSNITKDIEIKIKDPVAKLVNGSINKIGSQVCIEDECFYITKNDGTTVTMLSKYNLHVGSKWTGPAVIALENPTGIQDSKAIGWFAERSQSNPVIGTVGVYAGTESYWKSTTSSYPAYIYNSNSLMYNYLENYKIVLTNKGASISNIRLIDIDELTALGCNTSTNLCTNSSYSWLYSTSYWTGNASSDGDVWNVMTDGSINSSMTIKDFSAGNDVLSEDTWQQMLYGARPVIELPVDEVYIPPSNAYLKTGDINEIGSEVCIDEECFYILKNDGTNVSMISKYNLHIGNTYDGTVVPLENPTGIQNEKAIGWFSGRSKTNPIIGSIGFYNYGNIYWSSSVSNYPAYVFNANSPIYSHLQNYKNILINKGANVSNIRLIEVNELVNLGCNISSSSCTSSQYPWLYSTSYWTGSAASSSTVYHVMSNGNLNSNITFTDFNYGSDTLVTETYHEILTGARPVIEMPVSGIH